MLKNQIKYAFRNLWKNKVFSLINVVGLSIGLSASLVIALLVYFDSTFDTFHKGIDKIYRVTTDYTFDGEPFYVRGVPAPLKSEVANIDGVVATAPFFEASIKKVSDKNNENTFRNIGDAILTNDNYFNLFQYKWVTSKPNKVLSNPNEVVLTKKRAVRYFPNVAVKNIVGKTLQYNDSISVKVVGVVESFKERTDFTFQEFLSDKTAKSLGLQETVFNPEWNSTNSSNQLFIKLSDNSIASATLKQLDHLSFIHRSEKDKPVDPKNTKKYYLEPLKELHFSKYGIFNITKNIGSKDILKGLGLVALFLLLLGCINFVNLSTAQATKRNKEVGVRKTLGSSKANLISQFIIEALLLTGVAGFLSLFLSYFLLGQFADFIPETVSFSLFLEPKLIVITIVLLVLVALFAGLYPAFVLANFKPVSALKNQISLGKGNVSLRKSLTVFQFVIAQIFIVATLLVGKQLSFVTNKNMGFNTNATAYIDMWDKGDLNQRIAFLKEVQQIPELANASLGGIPPASMSINSTSYTYIADGKEVETTVEQLHGDVNYLETYNVGLLAGRKILTDTIKNEFVINETYAKKLGLTPVEAVGKTLKSGKEIISIVGVMKDFHQRTLKEPIKPMIFKGDTRRERFSQFYFMHFSFGNMKNTQWKTAMSKIETLWKKFFPEEHFELTFLDESIKNFYEQERKTTVLLNWATVLAILISCLGLLGLVIYTTERRVKEIGVRKILGASVTQLGVLLTKEFVILLVIAFLIAMPIAWYGVDYWLQSFAYKTSISWWIFALAGITMTLTSFMIVGFRIWNVAHKNPTETLRSE